MTVDLHARLVARVDGSTAEGRALLAVLGLHDPLLPSRPGEETICFKCGDLSDEHWPCSTIQAIASVFGMPANQGQLYREKIRAVFEDGPTDPGLWIVEGMTWPNDYQWVVFDEPTRHMHKCVWNHVGGGHYRLSEIQDLGPAMPKAGLGE